MRASSSVLSCLVLAAAATIAGPAAHAAGPPACGDVLAADTRLTSDLVCPSGTGLVLTAGVTLDLGGHTVRGAGGGTGLVVARDGDVTVHSGTLTGWGAGLAVDGDGDVEVSGTTTVRRLAFTGNGYGIDNSGDLGSNGKPLVVERSTFTHNSQGFFAVYGGGTFRLSTFSANGTAVDVITGGVRLERSRVQGNRAGIACDESYCAAERTTFVDNDVAVEGRSFTFVEVLDSTLLGNGVGIDNGGAHGLVTVRGSTLTDNGTAVRTAHSSVELAGNTFRRNGTGFTAEPPDPQIGATGTLRDNRFLDGGDGVVTGWPGIALGGNRAAGNDGWGLYAPHATDLGGNTAVGNGTDPQCVGVVCG